MPVKHGTFAIERIYNAPPARVFNAFADPEIKRRWFVEGDGWTVTRYETDFRVGGHERSEFRFKDGPVIANDTIYQDIVENERIVIAYTMAAEGHRFSSSLSTIEFEPHGKGTKLTYTEQIACLDGNDQSASRREGCVALFEALDAELVRMDAA